MCGPFRRAGRSEPTAASFPVFKSFGAVPSFNHSHSDWGDFKSASQTVAMSMPFVDFQFERDFQSEFRSYNVSSTIRDCRLRLPLKSPVRRTAAQYAKSALAVHGLSQGRQVSGEAIRKLAGEALERAAEDFDLFICMGINPSDETETFAHATNVATLAIGLGIVLGQSVEALEELGMGCLLHDAGMLRIDQRIARSNEWITERDYRELAEHPLIAVDLLDKLVDRVPLAAHMVVYQMHERGDGSG